MTEILKFGSSFAGAWAASSAVTIAVAAFGIGTGGVGFVLVGVVAAGAGVAGGYWGGEVGKWGASIINGD